MLNTEVLEQAEDLARNLLFPEPWWRTWKPRPQTIYSCMVHTGTHMNF